MKGRLTIKKPRFFTSSVLSSIVTVCVLFYLFTNGCDAPKATASSKGLPLPSQWILHYFEDNGKKDYAGSKTSNFIISEDLKTFEGRSECNSFSGKLVVSKQRIQFKDMISTEMACDLLDLEQRFFNKLLAVDSYEIIGGELFLKKNGTTILVMESFRK